MRGSSDRIFQELLSNVRCNEMVYNININLILGTDAKFLLCEGKCTTL
jgi:hypothetical protein